MQADQSSFSEDQFFIDFDYIKKVNDQEIAITSKTTIPILCKGTKTIHLENGEKNEVQCLNSHFWSKGTDKHHSALPLILQCKACGARCYPHTSYEFQEKARVLVGTFLIETFSDHKTITGQEKNYALSIGRLSQIGQEFKNYITSILQNQNQFIENINSSSIANPNFAFHQQLGRLETINGQPRLIGQSSTEMVIPFSSDVSDSIVVDSAFSSVMRGIVNSTSLDYSKAIIMDETFLKIGGIMYCLIIAVSKEGELLSWTLSRTRKTQDLNYVFQEALTKSPFPGIIVSDHFAGYHAMVKLYPYPIIHISHIHKPPYNRAIIYQRFFFPEQNKIVELQLGVNTGIFSSSGQQLLKYDIQETPLKKPPGKPRGRPKGQKNRPKEIIQQEKSKKKTQIKKKRGRKSPFTSQNFASCTVNIEQNSLSVDDISDQFLSDRIFFLLFTLFVMFKGKHLTSNYAENIFSQLKLHLSRGLKSDPFKFIQTFSLFSIENYDRLNQEHLLEELVSSYLEDFPPPIGFGYRSYFKGPILPFMFQFTS